ncbi:MAG TPA: hypothetical protein VFE50_16710 [Cyclobacteriaceae bacterium]|nr:hypothetical protein [Cyclobacteriaceae bacterium]
MPKLFLVPVLILSMSCKYPNYERDCNLDGVIKCTLTELPDSTTVIKKLKGKWEWKWNLGCAYLTGDPRDEVTYKGIILEFFDNDEGQYTRNGVVTKFRWKLGTTSSGDYFTLRDADRPTWPLPGPFTGTIFMCDDWLVLSNRAVDSDDNIFKRL